MSTILNQTGHTYLGVDDIKEVTKKVRMSRDRAGRLAALARTTGKTESELLREGLDLLEWQEQKRAALQVIIDTLEPGEAHQKARLRFK